MESSERFRLAVPDRRLEVIRAAGERGEAVIQQSMTGRLRFSVPVVFDHEHIATIQGGGIVDRPMTEDHVRGLAETFGVDADELWGAAQKLYVADRSIVESSARLIAALTAHVIETVKLREVAELRSRRLTILSEVGYTMTGSLDLLRVLDSVVEAVPQVMDVKAAVVALLDDDGRALRIRAGVGLSDEFLQIRFEPGTGLLGHTALTGEPLNVPDMLDDPRNAYVQHDSREGIRALLANALRDGDRVIGVLGAFHGEPHSFTGGDEQTLAILADYAATAVRNARLYQRMTQAYRELGVATRGLQDVQGQLLHADRLATLGRVAGDTAHEMKNTLGGIIGVAATARDHLDQLDDKDVREMLAAIAEEGWRLRDKIEELRGYGKPVHFGTGRHNVAETIHNAVRLLRFDQTVQDLAFEVQCPPDLEYEGDRDRVKQVLINLLRNASEAFEGIERTPRVAVNAGAADGQVRIEITDNGVGIPPERIERIWEPFYTTKGEAGTGLGLDTVRQIVRAQGGDVEVRSQVGVGTTFEVLLPRAAEGSQTAS